MTTLNSNNSIVALAREGASLYATGGASQERGLSLTTGALAIGYQTDDQMRAKIVAFLGSRSKDAAKSAKDAATVWLADTFDLVKPDSAARPLAKYTYANRVKAYTLAMQRIVIVASKGYIITQDAKDKRKFAVTVESYRKVTGDKDAKENVIVSDKAHAGSNMVQWSRLSFQKDAPSTGAKGNKASVPMVTSGNIKTICAGIVNGLDADKGVDIAKLSGADRLSMLKAFFALGNALGSDVYKRDTALLAEYDTLAKAQVA